MPLLSWHDGGQQTPQAATKRGRVVLTQLALGVTPGARDLPLQHGSQRSTGKQLLSLGSVCVLYHQSYIIWTVGA